MDDLETAALKTQLEVLRHRWRNDMQAARAKANTPTLGDEARYQAGYADALDRAIQAVKMLEDQW
jgi:hypothetical protein